MFKHTGWLALVIAFVLKGTAPASAAQVPVISLPLKCVAGGCQATVRYAPTVGDIPVRVEIAWFHRGTSDTSFYPDATLECARADSPYDANVAPDTAMTRCEQRGPKYSKPAKVTVLVRVTPTGGQAKFTRRTFDVVGAASPTAGRPGRAVEPDLCAPRRQGVQCGPGNGRRTPGGGEKVSHKGWPAITGILWKVVMAAGRHQKTGGPKNDELLGHHGNEVLRGGGGKDVIWGDWDPYNNNTTQVDRLYGDAGNDWIYSSHGRNTISGGGGKDYIWAYYGRGSIDCGPGFDTLRIRIGAPYRVRGCERVKNFCSFGSKPGNRGGCYKPGERPKQ